MEYRDLYNVKRELTGERILKNDIIPDNRYIMMVVIFIENNNHEFLIQKRVSNKGGKWATTGGHPKSGESSLEGIIAEVGEELGIKINFPILFKRAEGKNTFCDLYYLKKNISLSDLTIQAEEVENVKWASIDEIKRLMKNDEFNKGHFMMFNDCLEFIGQNKGT